MSPNVKKTGCSPYNLSRQNVQVAIVCGTIIINLQEVKIEHYSKDKEREVKINYRAIVSILHGIQFAKCSGQTDSLKLQYKDITYRDTQIGVSPQ